LWGFIRVLGALVLLTAFSAIFLNEKVRWRRWSAVLLGFIGVVVVIDPGKLETSYYFIFPIFVGLISYWFLIFVYYQ
jgi:drug/metabolite transporter (DMT)-like permease